MSLRDYPAVYTGYDRREYYYFVPTLLYVISFTPRAPGHNVSQYQDIRPVKRTFLLGFHKVPHFDVGSSFSSE